MKAIPAPSPADADEEISALIATLHETGKRLEELTGGEVDAVAGPEGGSFLLPHAQERLRHRQATKQAAILDALPAHIAMLDAQGMILSVNEAWRQFAASNALQRPGYVVGLNYLDICEDSRGSGSSDARAVAAGIRAVLGGASDYSFEYACHAPNEQRWFLMRVTPLSNDGPSGAVVMHVNITERRLAEEALRESENRFRGTFEQAAVGIAHVSPGGSFLRVNDKLCHITGYGREELLAMAFVDLTLPEDRAESLAARNAMVAGTQEFYTVEKRYRRKDGELVWVNLVTTLDKRTTGDARYFISVYEDITVRKLAELRLNRLNRLHTVLSRISETIVRTQDRQQLYDAVCRIVVDDGLLRMAFIAEADPVTGRVRSVASHGERLDYLLGLNVTTDDGPLGWGTVGTAIRTGVADVCNDFACDPRMQPWRDDALRHGFLATASFPLQSSETIIGALVLFAGEVGYFQDDEIRLMVAVANELSFALEAQRKEQDRHRAQRALRASEQQFSSAFTYASIGVALVSPAGRFLKVNRALCHMLGYAEADLLTRTFQDVTQPEDLSADLENFGRLIRGEVESYEMEKRYLHQQGHLVWALLSVSLVRDDANRPVHFIAQVQDISAQRQAHEEIRRQAHMLDHIGQAVIATDAAGRIVYANRFAGELHGWTPAEMLGRDIMEVTVPQTTTEQAADLMARLSHGENWSGEFPVQSRDGRVFSALVTDSPLLDDRGHLTGIIRVSVDISARLQAEAEVQFNEQRYRSLVEATTAIVWDTPASGEFEREQPGWEAFTGQTFAEYRGWGWLQAIHRHDQKETARVWSAAVNSRTFYAVEHRLRARDQTYRNMLARGVPILGEDGNIRQWIGIHTDITERRQSEQRIAEQAALIDESRDAISVRDLDDHITFWSKGAGRLYGWTTEEAQGRVMHELLQFDAFKFSEAASAVRETGVWNGTIQKTAKNGAVLTLDARWTLMRDSDGQPRSILSIDTDVTERKKIEQRFLRSQRMESIGTLAGGIAHDLNNVLAPILMGVDFLKMKYPDAAGILDRFETSANRGAGMVRQLLTFAKGMEGERVSIQTSHLVKEMKELMQGTFPKDIELVVACDPDLPTVLGDATQLHQILLNLCVNARDAMPSGGTLTVEAQVLDVDAAYAAAVPDARPGRYVALRVQDTGMGIPPAVLDRIFDPFFTTKGPDKGTGLGLSTVMGIVKGLGGFLQVASTPGQGSTFAVHLPAELAGDSNVIAARSMPLFGGAGETILLVDDEPGVLEVGRLVLTGLSYTVVTAVDGTEALVKAIEHRDELRTVITDMHMPHMDGLAFIRAFRRVLPHIPVIIGSGRLDDAIAHELKTLGVTDRLDKPYTQKMLAALLTTVLDGTQATVGG